MMTVKGGSSPACAACKYQRRKCSPNCPLAPYFPATQLKTFQNVHRLFGVSNVTKTLEKLQTRDEKEDAMKSIIFEAEMRERFPVHGCCAIIAQLRLQLHLACDELHQVHAQLEACRDQAAVAPPPAAAAFGFDGEYSGGGGNMFLYDDEAKPLLALEGLRNENSLLAIQAQMDAFGLHQNLDVNNQGVDVNCEDDNFLSSCDSSDQTLPEKKAGSGCRRELKTAAAGFSLTTVK